MKISRTDMTETQPEMDVAIMITVVRLLHVSGESEGDGLLCRVWFEVGSLL